MTRRKFIAWVSAVTSFYGLAIVLGFWLRWPIDRPASHAYGLFEDLVPLLVALPAAWLGFCFQRRISFLQNVRTMWSLLVPTVQAGIQYTYHPNPTYEQYSEMLASLSTAIDEIRGTFKNIGEAPGRRGLFPFEPLKRIHAKLAELSYGDSFKEGDAPEVRRQVVELWKRMQPYFLAELERDKPAKPSSPYVQE